MQPSLASLQTVTGTTNQYLAVMNPPQPGGTANKDAQQQSVPPRQLSYVPSYAVVQLPVTWAVVTVTLLFLVLLVLLLVCYNTLC